MDRPELEGREVKDTAGSTTTYDRMVGLSNGDTNTATADIDFALEEAPSGSLKIFENGVQVGPTNLTHVAGDILKVEVVGGMSRSLLRMAGSGGGES